MTVKELQQQLEGCDPDKVVFTHAYLTDQELRSLLDRCEECGAGPDYKVALQMQGIKETDHNSHTGTCFLYLD